jgi:hypothetical protein
MVSGSFCLAKWGEIARAKGAAPMGTVIRPHRWRGALLALGKSLATCATCGPHPQPSLPNGAGESRKGKLTTVWVIRVIIGDVDGTSVELALGWYIWNATRDL